jgi:hypothetical protein
MAVYVCWSWLRRRVASAVSMFQSLPHCFSRLPLSDSEWFITSFPKAHAGQSSPSGSSDLCPARVVLSRVGRRDFELNDTLQLFPFNVVGKTDKNMAFPFLDPMSHSTILRSVEVTTSNVSLATLSFLFTALLGTNYHPVTCIFTVVLTTELDSKGGCGPGISDQRQES